MLWDAIFAFGADRTPLPAGRPPPPPPPSAGMRASALLAHRSPPFGLALVDFIAVAMLIYVRAALPFPPLLTATVAPCAEPPPCALLCA